MKSKFVLNVPNVLSLYRLLMFPVVMIFAIKKLETLFVVFFCINLITDILDGWIARRFNQQTEFGARLDSLADIGTFILAFIGIYVFKLDDFQPYIISLILFISLFTAAQILSILRFGTTQSFHLYSWKIGGYLQGVFFFLLFTYGFIPVYYIIVISWGILAFIEHIIIQLMLKETSSNLKGLYWVIQNKKK